MPKREYMDWADYKAHIDRLDIFSWQQRVRRSNLRNLV